MGHAGAMGVAARWAGGLITRTAQLAYHPPSPQTFSFFLARRWVTTANTVFRYNLSAELDPRNAGVLVVDLQGRGAGRSRDAGGLVDQMGGDKDCVIM